MLQEPAGVTYSRSVEQLGIFPVYPPREDLQVGDIYAIASHSERDRLDAKSAFLASIDLSSDIKEYLSGRYVFGDTAPSADNQTINLVQTDANGTGKVLAHSDLTTLPITGFPEIEVNTGLSLAFGGSQPGSLLNMFLGANAGRSLKMRLKFNGVTSYSVPIITARARLQAFCTANEQACKSDVLANIINEKYILADSSPTVVREASILLVSKVYLARQIEYTYNDAAFAAAALRRVSSTGEAGFVNPGTIEAAAAAGDADMIKALADLQTALATSVQANADTEEGSTFSIAAISQNSITFAQVFQRPVVIGYEGISRALSPRAQ